MALFLEIKESNASFAFIVIAMDLCFIFSQCTKALAITVWRALYINETILNHVVR